MSFKPHVAIMLKNAYAKIAALRRIKSGCQKKPGKMLKMSTEAGQQNKFILTS